MATKSLLKMRGKKKPIKASAAALNLYDAKFYGADPPKVTSTMSSDQRAKFLTWCNYMVDPPMARDWLEAYLKKTGRSLKGVPNQWITASTCHRARLHTLGAPFTAEQLGLLEDNVKQILSHAEEPDADDGVVRAYRPSIQELLREKTSEIIGEIEGMIDDGTVTTALDSLLREKSNPKIARSIVDKFTPQLQFLEEVALWKDPELKESYRHLGRDGVRKLRDDYIFLVTQTQRFISNTVKARPVRKAKPPSIEKKLRFFTYLKYSKEFNVNSFDPAKIIGAQEIWLFNTKYKILTVFRAMGGQLDVSRRKIIQYDPNNSYSYRVGRKPEAAVAYVLNNSKPALKKLVADLKTCPIQDTVNEATVLLKV